MMSKTIVTGASGFLGSHLMRRLPDAKPVKHDDIYVFARYDWERLFFLSTYGNMAHHHDYWSMVKANVRDPISTLLGFTGWFCYMSSSSVTLPVQTPYSRTKRAAEEILQALPELECCIVRCYSVTGVGEQKEHLIPTLIRSCMEGEEMQFDLEPVHDFVDVSDVVDCLISLSESKATGIFELGSGIPHTNQEVREIVERVCGKKANIKSVSRMRPYDNDSWYCRNPHAYLRQTKSLEQSINEMVEAYKRERVGA